jgi:hypothetical protein
MEVHCRNPITYARYPGIAVALAGVARDEGEPDIAASIMKQMGLSVDNFEAAGIDPYDLVELENAAWQ